MPSKRKNNRLKENKSLISFVKLQIITAANYTILLILSGLISVVSDMSVRHMYALSLAVFASGSFISGFISGLNNRKNGMLSGVLSALPINILFIIISLFMNGMTCDLRLIVTLAVIIFSSAIGGIISVNRKVRK